jgi:RNA polymerase-binding transcription factor DksA
MNQNDIQKFKNALLKEQELLKGQLDRLGQQDAEHPGDWVAKNTDTDILPADENEVADEMEAFQDNQAILGNIEKRYREVTAALDRIENGTYGICKVSGEPIEMERLEANPAAETSMKHMDK